MKLLAALFALSLTSCASFIGALTGQPIPTTSVQRAGQPDSPVVQVASADYAVAEFAPNKIHGLYDAGLVAAKVREVTVNAAK